QGDTDYRESSRRPRFRSRQGSKEHRVLRIPLLNGLPAPVEHKTWHSLQLLPRRMALTSMDHPKPRRSFARRTRFAPNIALVSAVSFTELTKRRLRRCPIGVLVVIFATVKCGARSSSRARLSTQRRSCPWPGGGTSLRSRTNLFCVASSSSPPGSSKEANFAIKAA